MAFRKATKLSLPVCLSLGLIGAANASPFTNGDFETPNIGNTFYTTYNDAAPGSPDGPLSHRALMLQ